MGLAYTENFFLTVSNISPDRAAAIADALAKFVDSPDDKLLEFRPMVRSLNYYIIKSRKGDVIILRKDGDDTFIAEDVGPYATLLHRWGNPI